MGTLKPYLITALVVIVVLFVYFNLLKNPLKIQAAYEQDYDRI